LKGAADPNPALSGQGMVRAEMAQTREPLRQAGENDITASDILINQPWAYIHTKSRTLNLLNDGKAQILERRADGAGPKLNSQLSAGGEALGRLGESEW